MNTSVNKANLSALGPWLVVLAMGIDKKMGWDMGDAWYGAAASLLIWILTYYVPNKTAETPPTSSGTTLSCSILPLLIIGALMLSGCSMVPYYSQIKQVADTGITTAIKDRQEFNDKKLAVNLAGLCDSSIGAVNRYPNGEVRDFVNKLCGGSPGITADQLGRIAQLMDTLQGKPSAPIVLSPVQETPLVEP